MSFKFTISAFALAAASLVAAAPSHAAVIDFNGQAGADLPGGWAFPDVYTRFYGPATISGYVFTPPSDALWTVSHINSWLFCFGYSTHCATNQTDYLLSENSLSVRREDGAAFNLNGFELGNYFDSTDDGASPMSTWLVLGTRAAGGTVSEVITLDNVRNSESAADFNSFRFDGFTGLLNFDILRLSAGNTVSLALDNLDVSTAVPGKVPEPSTLALLGIAAAGLLGRFKRGAA